MHQSTPTETSGAANFRYNLAAFCVLAIGRSGRRGRVARALMMLPQIQSARMVASTAQVASVSLLSSVSAPADAVISVCGWASSHGTVGLCTVGLCTRRRSSFASLQPSFSSWLQGSRLACTRAQR